MIAEFDIGVRYSPIVPKLFTGYIKFCNITNNGKFVFRHDLPDATSEIITVDSTNRVTKACHDTNICSLWQSTFDEYTYILCQKPTRLVMRKGDQLIQEYQLYGYENYSPLFITDNQDSVIITMMPATLLTISKKDFSVSSKIDLHKHGYIEPIYVDFDQDKYVITDSSNHTVTIVDPNMHVYWQYGIANSPSTDTNSLCVPTSAVIDGDRIIISEQRSHRILIIDRTTKRVEKILGKTNTVGGKNNLLWAPQAVKYKNTLYAVMCKGANIYIEEYDAKNNNWRNYYGLPIILESDLNFPRSCDYSFTLKLLAVADTYHDRIIVYDHLGKIQKIIRETNNYTLRWPRCAKWYRDKLFIANSLVRQILVLDANYEILDTFSFNSKTFAKEWIQSIDILNNLMLVTFETGVILVDMNSKKELWSSKSLGISMRDIHHAQLISAGIVLISDTGNNRGVLIQGSSVRIIDKLFLDNRLISMKKPRFIRVEGEYLYIINSGKSEVLICDKNTLQVVNKYGYSRGLSHDRLSIPRWLCQGPYGMHYISDTDNHRIILRKIIEDKHDYK